ncbi:thiamine phosphate synthase [Dysgonomonas sp. 216]|uniref:thiamine phosphate synthase n=1 Tax=Dysgonomonas sp. 216 TaxID=2302934 RepID=UPI0013D1F9E1|nr:thiamine phosphate synthase [Dysgonomonas sp. 216]NDW19187.1 thiamine phosphate synthase [Dysgonomonas sp. 216]
MELIVITNENLFDGEAEALNLLFEHDLQTLHLRKPHATEIGIEHVINKVNSEYRNRIVLHDCFNLIHKYDLKGVHLNSRNTNFPQKEGLSVSRSCHSFEEVEKFSDLNYVFLSPIFDSISKQGYNKAFSDRDLLEARDTGIINKKVFALGGITAQNISEAAQFGFGGVVVLGTLWEDYVLKKDKSGLIARLYELQSICNRL